MSSANICGGTSFARTRIKSGLRLVPSNKTFIREVIASRFEWPFLHKKEEVTSTLVREKSNGTPVPEIIKRAASIELFSSTNFKNPAVPVVTGLLGSE